MHWRTKILSIINKGFIFRDIFTHLLFQDVFYLLAVQFTSIHYFAVSPKPEQQDINFFKKIKVETNLKFKSLFVDISDVFQPKCELSFYFPYVQFDFDLISYNSLICNACAYKFKEEIKLPRTILMKLKIRYASNNPY